MTDPLRVLVCGSRDWKDALAIWDALSNLHHTSPRRPMVVIEGECSGADKIAGHSALLMGLELWPVPAQWNKFGKSAGPRRNAEMMALGPSLVLAFHDDLSHSRGTADMVRKALAAGIPVHHYYHRQVVTTEIAHRVLLSAEDFTDRPCYTVTRQRPEHH